MEARAMEAQAMEAQAMEARAMKAQAMEARAMEAKTIVLCNLIAYVYDYKPSLDFITKKNRQDGLEHHRLIKYRNNYLIVLKAVNAYGYELQYASQRLKNDFRIVKEAVLNDPCSIQFASTTLRDNYELGLIAVQENGLALTYLSKCLQDNANIVSSAVKSRPEVLQSLSEPWRSNLDVLHIALSTNGVLIQYVGTTHPFYYDLLVIAIKQNSRALDFVSREYKEDHFLVSLVLKNRGYLSNNYISSNLRETVFQAVTTNPEAFILIKGIFKIDYEIVQEAVRQDGNMLEYLTREYKKDQFLVLLAFKNLGYLLSGYTSSDLRETVLQAVTNNYKAFILIKEIFKNDYEIVLQAVWQDGYMLQYASDKLQSNEFIKMIAKKANDEIFRYYNRY
jgi:hypothetical protein